MNDRLNIQSPLEPWLRVSRQCAEQGPQPADASLGWTANHIRMNPGVVERVSDMGFDARVQGVDLNEAPADLRLDEREWWRTGWRIADDDLREDAP